MLPRHPALLAFCCISSLTACTPAHGLGPDTIAARCPVSFAKPLLIFELFFGRSMPASGEVTDRQWQAFIEQNVTPALPQGFTIYDATGSWMSPLRHKTIYERTKVLMVALPDTPSSIVGIERIRNDYRTRFHQQVVGMTVTRACGAF